MLHFNFIHIITLYNYYFCVKTLTHIHYHYYFIIASIAISEGNVFLAKPYESHKITKSFISTKHNTDFSYLSILKNHVPSLFINTLISIHLNNICYE